MQLLVTGGSSFLGSHILKRAPKHWQIAATYFSHLIKQENVVAFRVDMRDEDAVRRVVAETQPDVLIHTPAVMSGEMLNPLNIDGSRHIALAAKEAHARLIHISSDVIFDGEHAPYAEHSTLQPITPYAQSKVRGEHAVREENPTTLIVRTSLIYNVNPIDARTRDILDGKMPRLFTDEYRSPIFVQDLADALIEIASDWVPTPNLHDGSEAIVAFPKFINIAGPQKLSRYEFGLKLAHAFNVEPRFETALSASHPTPRPRDVALDISLAQKILKTKLRSVDEVIRELKRIN